MGFTQEEIVNYEVAVDTIRNLISIYTAQQYAEEKKETPNQDIIDDLNQEISRLWQERRDLEISERAKIARIRFAYGAAVRAFRAENNCERSRR